MSFTLQLTILCPLIFLAAFIDSIAGGGGLISLNSYLATGMDNLNSLGTNKFSSFVGCTIASVNFLRTGNYHLASLLPALFGALVGSWCGSHLALGINKDVFTLIMLVATPLVAVLTLMKKDFSNKEKKELSNTAYMTGGGLIGLIVGFYDGFFGPGAGMFMQLGFIMILGLEPKKAAGNARMVNWASNLAALTTFIINGNVIYKVGIPCAICSVAGNLIGSRLAIKKDVKVIKPAMLVVIVLLLAKLAFDYFG